MRWLPSLGVGLLSGVLAAIAAVWTGDLATGWHHVSDREGGRGMFIGFILLPAGFLVGLVVGTWTARSHEGSALLGLARGVGIPLGLVALCTGLAWVTVHRPPMIDGQTLRLEVELKVPRGHPAHDSLQAREFRVGLVASTKDRAYLDLDLEGARTDGDYRLVTGSGAIQSAGLRDLSASYGTFEERKPAQFVSIPLAPRPTREDMEWSPWFAMNRFMDLSEVPATEHVQVRYRVALAGPPEP